MTTEIKTFFDDSFHEIEFIEDEHIYLIDGVITPSVSTILRNTINQNKYDYVPETLLRLRAYEGTKIHKAIQNYCELGEEDQSEELKGFEYLMETYELDSVDNEKVVLIFDNSKKVIACGRYDLCLIHTNGGFDRGLGGADIKCTGSLDKESLYYQLNLYRIGANQTYGYNWGFLYGIQLKGSLRHLMEIPINEELPKKLIKKYYKEFLNKEVDL